MDRLKRKQYTKEFKRECLVNWRELPAESVRQDIVEYIEMFYNSERLHSYNGYYI